MSRVLSAYRNGEIEFRLLTEDRVEDAFAVLLQTMRTECVALGVGMFEEAGNAEEMQLLFREVIKDGVSIIAVDTASGAVAGVAFNKIQVRGEEGEKDPLEVFIERKMKNERCLELLRFLDHVESRVNIFDKFRTNAVMEIFYVGTNPEYRGRGIAGEIIRVSVNFCRGLRNGESQKRRIFGELINEEAVPDAVFGVFASDYSQKIVERLGFEWLTVVRYEDYWCKGKRMSDRISGGHKTAKLAALKL